VCLWALYRPLAPYDVVLCEVIFPHQVDTKGRGEGDDSRNGDDDNNNHNEGQGAREERRLREGASERARREVPSF
jgi:hypothetical protein